ncbi:Receptor-like protein kinase, partial [Thalictrum thalictroides]
MAGINTFLQLLLLLLLFGSLYLKTIKLCLCNNDVKVPCLHIERQALLQFKEAIIDTSGRLSSWHGDYYCCGWEGVGCDNKTGHVLKLQLGNPMSLLDDSGYFERSTLSENLRVLDLSSSNFSGKIPSQLGNLEKLRVLDLSSSNFGGKIPSQLGNLSNLIYLNLYDNWGIYAETLNWFSGLSSLSYLNLGYAKLSAGSTKWLEHVCMLPSLRFLILKYSEIYYLPSSPPNSFGNITYLTGIDLSANPFNSPIPQWLFNLSSLQYMHLYSANLQGPIPDSFSNMTSLEDLDLSYNYNITGFIPPSFGKLCKLKTLDLAQNQIGGDIIGLFDHLSSGCTANTLRELFVDRNQLTGGLPISLGNLEKLIDLSVADNQLNGTIPESLGNLRHLESLDLSGNYWEGVLSEIHFANLTSLYSMRLILPSPMLLVWKVGTDWIPPFSLTYFLVANCQLGPLFPSWLQTQKNLSIVFLRNAGITDTLSDWFLNLSLRLLVVDLSNNEIKGRIPLGSSTMKFLVLRNNTFTADIPPNIGDMMPGLIYLDLSGNTIGGSIPSSICKMKNLRGLIVSDTFLSGELPRWCWKDLQELNYLNLANNSLFGTIPKSMGYLQSLQYLKLNTNNFYGKFPSFLQNCTQLTVLDLGGNNFTGDIGPWPNQSNYPSLQVLRLRSNLLMGNVPEGICNISNLQVLDIASNKFNGTIPKCFGNFYSMKDPEYIKYSFPLSY